MKTRVLSLAGGAMLSLVLPMAAQADMLETVMDAQTIKCGVSDNLPGFSTLNDEGAWTGFDADYCRAFSAAVFGAGDKVKFTPIAFNQSFTALQSGEVDVLSRSVTYTISRDTQLKVNFIPPTFYTGQSFMAHKKLGVNSVKDLSGAAICVLAGSVTERYIADYFRANDMEFNPIAIEQTSQVQAVYESGRCDAMSHETPSLAIARSRFNDPEAHVILPEVIAKSYEAPLVREGDDRWADIIRWTHFGLVTAEELGITQGNVDEMLKSNDPVVRTFLGVDGDIGEKMGLANDWAANVIRAVGNYGEIYDRHLGEESVLRIARGMNDLYERGGLLYAPSWR
ncbi:amino acid ABC transporter substrate-binding protein [Pikeienuella sp. HZG-20]|uniref:amino acid ABC transporter substrate-binding protein n=1 Tax=Paludibacillus litoralis TaxID=3133267 RepID=UPI0030ED1088